MGEKTKESTKMYNFIMDSSVETSLNLDPDGLTVTKAHSNNSWRNSSMKSCNSYTSGIHKFTVTILHSPN